MSVADRRDAPVNGIEDISLMLTIRSRSDRH
jgi:hypothetical protein